MNAPFLEVALIAAQFLIGTAMVIAFVRLALGPRAPDRVLALDTLYVDGMLLVLTQGLRAGNPYLFEAAFVIAALGFASTAAAAKFLLRGEVIE